MRLGQRTILTFFILGLMAACAACAARQPQPIRLIPVLDAAGHCWIFVELEDGAITVRRADYDRPCELNVRGR